MSLQKMLYSSSFTLLLCFTISICLFVIYEYLEDRYSTSLYKLSSERTLAGGQRDAIGIHKLKAHPKM